MINYNEIPSPSYVIDEERFRNNLSLIRKVADKSGAEIILAFKGFAMWGVFDILKEYFSGAAASSLHEARLCYEEIGSPAHTYSPVYRQDEFESIMNYSSHITFNSLRQYEKYSKKIKKYSKNISPGLRINPEFSEVSHGIYNPCSPGSRLGITAEDLSGGMAQRVALARALIQDPDFLLLDEPFGALDALTREHMGAELLHLWQERRKTVIMVTHSITEALLLADRVLVMSQSPGQILLDMPVKLPRPRNDEMRYTPQFGSMVRQLRAAIG